MAKENDTKWINVCDGKPTKTIQSGEHRQDVKRKDSQIIWKIQAF